MKITFFEGNKGDCILISSAGGRNILVDGGLVKTQFGKIDSYSHNVAKSLNALRNSGGELDLVCVSHIDQDHIGGIVRMLDDEFEWRVHKHQITQGLSVDPPQNLRPPKIKGIWHNSFHEQVSKNRGAITRAIAAAAPASIILDLDPRQHGNNTLEELGTSMREAAQLSRRIGARQLGIPLNFEFGGKLVQRTSATQPIGFGDLTVTVLGPTDKRLRALRKIWNDWLRSTKGKKQIKEVRHDAKEDERALIKGDFASFLQLADLGPAVGNRNTVTEQNVASIVILIEENGKSVLLTGDARDDHIVEDLIDIGKAGPDGNIHVDVLKVQHHGSENNFSTGFAKRVTADHYVFCGNGVHENPDLRVVKRLLDSRIGPADKRSQNPEAARPFKVWFTSDGSTFKADKHHMEKVMKVMKDRAQGSSPVMTYQFSKKNSFSLNL